MRTYDLRKARLVTEDVSHPITSFSLSNDGMSLAASCLDGIVRLWDNADDGDYDGKAAATTDGSSSRKRRTRKRVYGKLHSHHECKNYRVECAFASNDASVITGSECGGVAVYPVADHHDDSHRWKRTKDDYDGECGIGTTGRRAKSSAAAMARSSARTLRGHTGPTCSVAACPQMSRPWLILSSSYDGTALVWASREHRDCCIDG